MARACAAHTKACYLKLAGPSLVQMFIGDGAKLVRDAFELAKEKAPAIIFIDELDAIGTKRFDSDKSGDREVQRTMLELLNQLDGFSSDERIKVRSCPSRPLTQPHLVYLPHQVIAATNRIDILDPALLRSGRLDRKIEFPLPTETARARILEIHSRKMTVGPDVNFEELSRSTDEFNGAQLKAVCVEAGMIALREGATKLSHEHFISGIAEGEFILVFPLHKTHVLSSPKQEEERSPILRVVSLYHSRFLIITCTFLPFPKIEYPHPVTHGPSTKATFSKPGRLPPWSSPERSLRISRCATIPATESLESPPVPWRMV